MGSWKCGKGMAFTHITTTVINLNKTDVLKLFQNEGRKKL